MLLRPESCVLIVGEAEGVSTRMGFLHVTSAVFCARDITVADTERRGATFESASGTGGGSRARAVSVCVAEGTEAATEGTALVKVASGTDGVLSGGRHRRVDLVVEGFVLLFLWTFLFNFSYV